MKSPLLDRRAVLRGVAGVSVALPWLEAMGPAKRAQAATLSGFPKRLIVWFTPDGTIKNNWTPPGTDPTASRILAPLARYKDYVTVLDGVDNVASYNGVGDGHQTGMGCMLTGIELLPGSTKGGCDTCAPAGLAGGPSVDQVVVQKSAPNTKFSSLEMGIQTGGGGNAWSYSNYSAANMPLPLENSPANVWKRVFTDLQAGGGDPMALDRLKTERKSVLDATIKHYQTVAMKLGQSDRAKMNAHLQGVRDLETRLLAASPAGGAASCVKPPQTAATTDFRTTGKLHMDLLHMAMTCDLTRVGTIQWTRSVGSARMDWLGATRGQHDMSHDANDATTAARDVATGAAITMPTAEMLTRINIWYMEQLFYLVDKLAKTPEGAGNMLDNTLILCVNELSMGNAHNRTDMPFLLVGKAGGAHRSGRVLRYPGATRVPHNNLMVSVLNFMDVPATTFGNPKYCTGALTGL